MVTRISNVNPVQLGVVYATLYALLGFLFGIIFGLVSMAAGSLAASSGVPNFGWLSVIIFPIFYAVLGFIAGIIGGFFYNLVAGWTGGVELTLTTSPAAMVPTTTYAP